MKTDSLQVTRCAICGTEGNANELYPANFDIANLTPDVFSARRLPDRIHYRLVKCKACGLVRSDPIVSRELLAQLYAQSSFNYGTEVRDLCRTYGRYLTKLERYGARKGVLLEIGCGSGFFLEQALHQGYHAVRGVEPGRKAVDQADSRLKGCIVCGLMEQGVFAPEEFDVVCLFQVFDHVPDPGALLDECFRLLKPNGFVLCINHNIDAISARIYKERSPIIDIEHTYLYAFPTITRIFQAHGFQVRRTGAVWNTYNLGYIARLVPLPGFVKSRLLNWLKESVFGRIRLSVPLGNLFMIAQKPGSTLINSHTTS